MRIVDRSARRRRKAPVGSRTSSPRWSLGVLALALSLWANEVAATPLQVKGQILDRDGRAISTAIVEALPLQGRWLRDYEILSGRQEVEAIETARVDADGRFQIAFPKAGYWRLVVRAEGYLPAQNAFEPLLSDRILEPVQLQPAEIVSIRVVDDSGRGLAGARVVAEWSREISPRDRRSLGAGWTGVHRRHFTDEDGRVTLRRSPDESMKVDAWASGYLESATLELASESSAEIRLERGLETSLRIATSSGLPAEGVVARVGDGHWPGGLSDAAGETTVFLAAEGKTKLWLEGADGASTFLELDPEEETPDPIALEPPGELGGRLVERGTGRAVADAWVLLDYQYARVTRTDAKGRFKTTGRVREHSALKVAAAGYLPENEELKGGRLGIEITLDAARSLRGLVVDEQHRPLAGVRLSVAQRFDTRQQMQGFFRGSPRDSPHGTVSSSDGRFVVGELHPEATYTLEGRAPGFARTTMDVPEADDELLLILARGLALRGRLVGETGLGIADAEIELTEETDSRPFGVVYREPSESADPWTSVCDGEGRFLFPHLPEGRYALHTRAAGFAEARFSVKVALDQPEDLGDLELQRGVDVVGRVKGPDGRPLEGASITVQETRRMGGVTLSAGSGETFVTDRNGRFVVPDRRSGERLGIHVDLAGFAKQKIPGVEVPPETPLEIVLVPALRIVGRVVGDDGSPVERAMIVAIDESKLTTGGQVYTGMSDERGDFVVEGLSSGPLRVETRADGWKTHLAQVEVPADGDLEGLEIVLERGFEIEGRVFDSDGKAATGVSVSYVRAQQSRYIGTSTTPVDTNGYYLLQGVPAGAVQVRARRADGRSVTGEVEVTSGRHRLDLRFPRGAEVSGWVVTEDGESPTGGTAFLTSTTQVFGPREEARVDDEGRFRFEAVAEGTYRLGVEHDHYATALLDTPIQVTGSPSSGFEVLLKRGQSIGGQILGLESQELSDVRVLASDILEGRPTWGRVERDGRYEVENLVPGSWSISVVSPHGRAHTEVELLEGESRSDVDLLVSEGFELAGVVWQNDQPVGGLRVVLRSLGGASGTSGDTSRQGRFQLHGLDAGRYELMIFKVQSLVHREEVVLEGDTAVEVELETFEIRGTVVDADDGSPIEGVALRLEPAGERTVLPLMPSLQTSDFKGFFVFPDAPAGQAQLIVDKEGYAAREIDLTSPTGELEIALQPTLGVALQVTLPTGGPADIVDVNVLNRSGAVLIQRLRTAAPEGILRLRSVPPGEWTVLVSSRGSAVSLLEVTSPSSPVPVRLQPATRLSVRVDPLVEDDAGAVVRLLDERSRPFRIISFIALDRFQAFHGRAEISSVPPGTWTLVVEAADGQSWRKSITTRGEERQEVVVP